MEIAPVIIPANYCLVIFLITYHNGRYTHSREKVQYNNVPVKNYVKLIPKVHI